MKILGLGLLLASLLQCGGEAEVIRCYAMPCSQVATVRDLTGLDGCGWALELPNGTRLLPVQRIYVQPPSPEEDPLYYFELRAGDKVQISYEESKVFTTCMGGTSVFITCIKPLAQTFEQ